MAANPYYSKDGKRILTIPNGTNLTPTMGRVIDALIEGSATAETRTPYERRRRVVSISARSEGIAFYTKSEDTG